MLSIHVDKLRHNKQSRLVAVDVVMIVLVIVNLLLIAFQWLFHYHRIQDFLLQLWPAGFGWYKEHISNDFMLIDGAFVLVFIIELLIRWGLAIRRDTYAQWFYYPFVHWYDVLGCVPMTAFRAFRFFRIFSLGYRLQRMGVIDFSKSWVIVEGRNMLGVLMRQITNKVVYNVLSDTQEQVVEGNPMAARIVDEVVRPRRGEIAGWLATTVQESVQQVMESHRDQIRVYLDARISEAVEGNPEIAAIERIPLFGPQVAKLLEKAIADIAFGVIDGVAADFAEPDGAVAREVVDATIETIIWDRSEKIESHLSIMIREVINDSLELVKQQLERSQWELLMGEDPDETAEMAVPANALS